MPKVSGEIYRTIRLCVDSYDHGEMKGRYYHPSLEGGSRPFDSLAQFLISAEELFDSINFPQTFTLKRSFVRSANAVSAGQTGSETRKGACGTFVIRLMYRQHTSWQGRAAWLEGGRERPFRSVLELVFLMDSALGGREADLRSVPRAGRGEPA